MSDQPPDAPEPTVRVRLLATLDPTPTDRQRYDAGTEWKMPFSRAAALEAEGLAVLADAPAPALPTPSDED